MGLEATCGNGQGFGNGNLDDNWNLDDKGNLDVETRHLPRLFSGTDTLVRACVLYNETLGIGKSECLCHTIIDLEFFGGMTTPGSSPKQRPVPSA